jgi:hypothetical protein
MASIIRTAAAVAKEIQVRTAKMLQHKSFGVKASLAGLGKPVSPSTGLVIGYNLKLEFASLASHCAQFVFDPFPGGDLFSAPGDQEAGQIRCGPLNSWVARRW